MRKPMLTRLDSRYIDLSVNEYFGSQWVNLISDSQTNITTLIRKGIGILISWLLFNSDIALPPYLYV